MAFLLISVSLLDVQACWRGVTGYKCRRRIRAAARAAQVELRQATKALTMQALRTRRHSQRSQSAAHNAASTLSELLELLQPVPAMCTAQSIRHAVFVGLIRMLETHDAAGPHQSRLPARRRLGTAPPAAGTRA
jgi:hypothetical protein